MPIPRFLKPALGGLGVGLLALALPQILAGGYGWIQLAIDGQLAAGLLAAMLVGKLIALCLTISSGGSGGVFAPSLFVGGVLGGLVGALLGAPPAAFVVVGMAAVFGGAARVPIATLLMVTEMTGGYRLLVPATLAVMLSYVVQVAASRGLRYRSLYEAQVRGRADSAAHSGDYLDVALRILGERRLSVAEGSRQIDVSALLAAGLTLDLTDGLQLQLAPPLESSRFVGRSLREWQQLSPPRGLEVIAVLRGADTILPSSPLVLQSGDRLLLLGSSLELDELPGLLSDSPSAPAVSAAAASGAG
jgi:CIC family chloride channel protein